MALSPRRTIAIGLASTMCGTCVQLLGAAIAVWSQSSAMASLSFDDLSDRFPEAFGRAQAAQQFMTIVTLIGGALILFGFAVMGFGAIRWLWNEPDTRSGAAS